MIRALWAAALIAAGTAQAQDAPLSAIDWLSQSVRTPQPKAPKISPPGHRRPQIKEAPIAGQVPLPRVEIMPLDAPGPRAIGTRLAQDVGLPDDLWLGSDPQTVAEIIAATPRRPIPALQDLVRRMMLVRAPAPMQGNQRDFALARIDHLLEIGALTDAGALIEAAGVSDPDLFRRYFDVALLRGLEDDACKIMGTTPSVAPAFAARIFCLARGGDWSAAALTFGTARALGELPGDYEALLAHFLDPDLYEDDPLPPGKTTPTPLEFRIREAIGEPVSTAALPRAFRVADLRSHIGWKFQLDAAETLAAAGVLPATTLLGVYSDGRPSASGGVWDRAKAIQALDAALSERDAARVEAALPAAWKAVRTAHVEAALASVWGDRLGAIPLTGEAFDIAQTLRLLSPGYGAAQSADGFAMAIATAAPLPDPGPDAHRRAVAQAFTPDAAAPTALAQLAQDGKLGEAILRAVALFEAGKTGDPGLVRDALVFLRSAGLEEDARRAALQYLILDPNR